MLVAANTNPLNVVTMFMFYIKPNTGINMNNRLFTPLVPFLESRSIKPSLSPPTPHPPNQDGPGASDRDQVEGRN